MLLAIEKHKAAEIMKEYYTLLSMMGYTKHQLVSRYLFLLFLLYFVERIYLLLDEKDYNLINKALIKLFSSANCLFSYKLLQHKKVTVGGQLYMGSFLIRTTESRSWRSAENGRIRVVEEE